MFQPGEDPAVQVNGEFPWTHHLLLQHRSSPHQRSESEYVSPTYRQEIAVEVPRDSGILPWFHPRPGLHLGAADGHDLAEEEVFVDRDL